MDDPKDPKNIVVPDEEEGVHQHSPVDSPAKTGEEEAVGGSAPDPRSDDDVDKMAEEVGIDREPGKTLADKIEEDAKANQTGEAEEPEVIEKEEEAQKEA